jgi:hypothetical protein
MMLTRGAHRMIFLFRHGPFRQKCWLILKATRQHARNLALFALIYKSSMLVLARAKSGKVHRWDPFIAGLLGGYTVFGRSIHSSVAQQIVIYVFARVCLATAKLAVQPHIAVEESAVYAAHHSGWGLLDQWPAGREAVRQHGWTAFATLSWAAVMWLFKWHPEVVQPSLRSSMNYMYVSVGFAKNQANGTADMSSRIIGIASRRSCGIMSRRGIWVAECESIASWVNMTASGTATRC